MIQATKKNLPIVLNMQVYAIFRKLGLLEAAKRVLQGDIPLNRCVEYVYNNDTPLTLKQMRYLQMVSNQVKNLDF